jgi:hypothetical protein
MEKLGVGECADAFAEMRSRTLEHLAVTAFRSTAVMKLSRA